jgi:3-hydroxyisobutyrate dehydrogenase-like beta-hydroxyacid dehydrogenase
MLEAPVTGGVHLAYRGEITVLAGGDKDLFELHRPAMQAMGGRSSTWGRWAVGGGHQGHHQHAGLHPPESRPRRR